MEIRVLKSNEIDQETWLAITEGFNESFQREKTADEFIDYYHNTTLGYSYHALAYDENGTLAGSTSLIPHWYSVEGEKVLFGLSGGSYVLKKFRKDAFIFLDMFKALRKYCQNEGMKAVCGVPNKNSFQYLKKIIGQTHLMDLSYYALPVKMASVLKLKRKTVLDFLSLIVAKSFIYLNDFFSKIYNSKAIESQVHILFDESFISQRFGKGYEILKNKNFRMIYKIVLEEGIKTAYLMEYREKNQRSFKALSWGIKHILKKEFVDIVLYVGTIKHNQSVLFKVPHKFEPQRLPLMFETFENTEESLKRILGKKENWDFGLANFDVR